MTKEKNKGGRPTKMNEDIKNFMKYLYREGKTDKQVAELVGICEATINSWKKRNVKFLESIKEEKLYADKDVVRSLYEKATGYSHPETVVKSVSHGLNGGSSIEEVEIIKRYAPDTAACIFWLKNRQPAKWRDKQEVEHSGDVNISFDKEDEGL